MTREEFKELFGEYPEDVLGQDWQSEICAYEDWSAKELNK